MKKRLLLTILSLMILFISINSNCYAKNKYENNFDKTINQYIEKYLKSNNIRLQNINHIHVNLKETNSKLEIIGSGIIYNDLINTEIINHNKSFNIAFRKSDNFSYNKNNDSYLFKNKNLNKTVSEEFSFNKTISQSNFDFISKTSFSINTSFFPYISNKNTTILSIALPKGFEATINGFSSFNKFNINNISIFLYILDKNVQEFHLFTSKNYKIQRKKINNIEFFTVFFKSNEKLSNEFIKKSSEYIKTYEKKFDTKYPYNKFLIIEDESLQGYSIPGAIVFSNKIINLPFVINRSLSHEVLHQWFGNAIQCSMTDGNWLEAITTLYSDYEIEKNKVDARKNILSTYNAYVKTPYPLTEFKGNYSKKDQSIGYGKGLMILYMAQNIIGEKAFNLRINKFIKEKMNSSASWKDLLEYLGMTQEFYNFWIKNKNIINIDIKNLEYKNNTLTFNFIRKTGMKEIKIPYTYRTDNKTYNEYFISKLGKTKFSKKIKNDNDTIYIDSNYDLMRNLFINEIESSFMYLQGDEPINFIGTKEEYIDFKDEYTNIEKHITLENLKPKHIENQNLIISMHHIVPEYIAKYFLPYISFSPELGRKVYKVIQNPYSNGDKFVLLILNYDILTLKKLKHYGNESNLVFNTDDKLEEKNKTKSNQGILVYSNKMFKGANK